MEQLPKQVYDKMMEHDRFSAWMGLQLDAIEPGYCKMHFTVHQDMLNGFQIIHGGILFAASDSVFAFACNTYGRLTVALDVSITFMRPAKEGDVLTVEAKEVHLGQKISVYEVKVYNEAAEILSSFKGTAYRTNKLVIEP